ncbi:MAG: hypothetical protein KGM43_07650 [Planctomycetota bacterium]|nr:hypothetical protein [Planctomycetota bacterium]
MSTLNVAARNVKPARYSRPFGKGLVDTEPTPAVAASMPARPAKGRVEYTPADVAWWTANAPNNALEATDAGPLPIPARRDKAVHKPRRKAAARFVPNPTDRQVADMVEDLGGYPKCQSYQARDDFAAEYSREYARRFGR